MKSSGRPGVTAFDGGASEIRQISNDVGVLAALERWNERTALVVERLDRVERSLRRSAR